VVSATFELQKKKNSAEPNNLEEKIDNLVKLLHSTSPSTASEKTTHFSGPGIPAASKSEIKSENSSEGGAVIKEQKKEERTKR